jgi:hypothetical protein
MYIPLLILMLILMWIGLLQMIYPKKVYLFARRWMYAREPELSPFYLVMSRIAGGVIAVIAGYNVIQMIRVLTF